MSRALYFLIEPSGLRLLQRTHRFPKALCPVGRSTKSQTWFVHLDSFPLSLLHSLYKHQDSFTGHRLHTFKLRSSCHGHIPSNPMDLTENLATLGSTKI